MTSSWVNKQASTQISIFDRGFCYGDGIFTTIKVVDGQCQLLPDHLARLAQGCQVLAIDYQIEQDVRDGVSTLAQALIDGVIKVVITRGEGQRGYSPSGCNNPTLVMTSASLPTYYQRWQQEGVTLGISPIKLGINPLLAGIKHLNRLEQVLIKQQLEHTSFDDALVVDCQDYVVETSMANIFWRIQDRVFTPILSYAGVAGVMRKAVISYLTAQNIALEQVRVTPDVLKMAEEVFITNSLMAVVPVTKIGTQAFSIGRITRVLASEFNNKDEQ